MRVLVLASVLLLGASGAVAQQWPSKPIRMISPYPPGGGIDASARIISLPLSAQLGQQVVVENRPGATGRIGTELAAKSPPDGYTLVMGSVAPNAIVPGSGVKLPYDAVKDFAPVSLVAAADYVLVVHPSLPVKTLKQLVALAKARPGQLTFASSGHLGAPHLAGELMNYLGQLSTVHVPYKGTGPAALAVLTGETVMTFGSGPAVTAHVQAGRLRAIASTGPKRTIADVPTMAETLPGCVVSQWYGVLAPAGTPQAIVDRLYSEIARAVSSPKIAEQFASLGTQAMSTTPADFAALIKSDIDKWGKVIRAAKIEVD
jgi:tripartite-type tricarboxylate transporter receptor subunit TctC